MNFIKWVLIFVITYAACEAVFVVIVAEILQLPFRNLPSAYLLLLSGGVFAAPLIYWSRKSYHRPTSFALRFAVSILLSSLIFTTMASIAAIKLGIVSQRVILVDLAPYIVPGSLIASGMVYRAMRRKAEEHFRPTQE